VIPRIRDSYFWRIGVSRHAFRIVCNPGSVPVSKSEVTWAGLRQRFNR
jgi:hypothetical protein